jgi:hypothetical protein
MKNRRKPSRYYLSDRETSLTGTKLRRSNRETKIEAMRTWFFSNYADPIESTPYDSAEGGYIYIWGGPYEPLDELQSEFGGLVSDDLIAELADELCGISWEWTGHPDYDEDDYFFESIAASTEHKESFEEALSPIEDLVAVKIKGEKRKHLLKLLYVNIITALETYLSDVFISYVGNNSALLRKYIETAPEFKLEKVPLAKIFIALDEVEKKARANLIDIVWHHLSKIRLMYKVTLDVSFPDDISALFKAVAIRHDLVHRNGKTKEGEKHSIKSDDVKKLVTSTKEFVAIIDMQLGGISAPQEIATANVDFHVADF